MKIFRQPTVLALIITHVLINSCGYLFVKVGLSEFEPFAFAFWRFVIGLSALSVIIFTRKAWPRVEKTDYLRFLGLAFLAVPCNQLLYLLGMHDTVPSHASLIYASTAGVAIILSTAIGYEKLRPLKVVAIFLALIGVALVISENPTVITGTEKFTGDALILVSMVAWASYTVLAKPMVNKYGAVNTTMTVLIFGSAMGLPFLITPAIHQNYSVITWHGWMGAIYAGLFITAAAYSLWGAILRRVEPSQAAIVTTPQPVVTTALSVLILGEKPGFALIAGGFLVIGGVLLMHRNAFSGKLLAFISDKE